MAEEFGMAHYCKFCNLLATLQCDGRMPDGKTCDNWICRRCAGVPVAMLRLAGPRRHDTRDLCPECREAKRSAF